MEKKSFKHLVDNYKLILFDAYGVLRHANGIIDGVEQTLKTLQSKGIDFFILTNDASKSAEELVEDYQKHGIDIIQPEHILSSAMLAERYFKKNLESGSRIVYMGADSSAFYPKRAGFEVTSIDRLSVDAYDDVDAFLFSDDGGSDFNTSIGKAISLLRKRKDIPVVCANPDLIYPCGDDQFNPAIGSIARLVESVVEQDFVYFGKPGVDFFEFAHQKHPHTISKSDVVMVGDTMYTDILGASNYGIDSVLVLTGSTHETMVEQEAKRVGVEPTFVCPSVAFDD